MNAEEYLKMDAAESKYWWHRGKLDLIHELLKQYFPGRYDLNILEIGCGTGEVLKAVSEYGDATGIDFSEIAVDLAKKKGLKKVFLKDINDVDANVHGAKYDLILTMDVLEHIRDDLTVLKKVFKMLKPCGYFFATVPAYKFLWSTHDEALQHLRRYHSLEIKQKTKDAGFKLEKCTHFVATLFFPIAAVRLLNNIVRRKAYPRSHYFPLPGWINNIFIKILHLEARIIKRVNLLFGTTLVVVGRKDEK